MSTYMYYRCMEHDPSLRSDEEIGQHYRDIPRSQELLKPEIRQHPGVTPELTPRLLSVR